jgi:V/A-type H+-transporting ATPase subunit D
MTGMTRGTRAPATRAGVLRYARRLDQVRRGAALLKRKRQSLVEELFRRARIAIDSREAIDAQALRAWRSLLHALSSSGSDGLMPFGWPPREIDVELTTVELWGLHAVRLSRRPPLVRSVAARAVLPDAGAAASYDAAREFELLLEMLIDAAPQEQAVRRLGDALSRTTRLVNTLEQRVITRLAADLAEVRRTLAEREREEHLRIKHLVRRRRDPAEQGPATAAARAPAPPGGRTAE